MRQETKAEEKTGGRSDRPSEETHRTISAGSFPLRGLPVSPRWLYLLESGRLLHENRRGQIQPQPERRVTR